MTPGIGGRTVVRILTRINAKGLDLDDFLALSVAGLREEFGLTQKQAQNLKAQGKPADSLQPHLERLGKFGVVWTTLTDATYPKSLEEFEKDPPGFLFLYGNTKLLNSKTFAVISSRKTPPAGLDLLETRAEQGVLNGEILVTGVNTAEYKRAALVPLRYGTPRIIVLDRGLFPSLGQNLNEELFASARLWRFQFDAKTDLVITPFGPDAGFKGINNKLRDRVVVGLASRLECIELSPEGGMSALAKQALEAGRDVLVTDRTIGYRKYQELGAEILRT